MDANIPMSQHVAAHREVLIKEKEVLPELHATRARLCEAKALCTTRRTKRMFVDIDTAIERLDAKIKRLETDQHLEDFERQLVPYMEAYVKHSGVPKPKVCKFVVPGEPKTHATQAETTKTQSDIVAEYLSVVQGGAPRPTIERSVDMCPTCIDSEMVLVPAKGILACAKCGRSATFLDATSSSISYEENVEMVTFSYKRGNHFQDIMQHSQGLETFVVPQKIVDDVMLELYKQRVTDVQEITTQKVRAILKTMKERKSYDHVAQIWSRVTGKTCPRLPTEAVELLKLMFNSLAAPFARHCPSNRKNFLSYSFLLSKMLYILGYDDLCNTLSLLKGQDKISKQDEVWKKITADLDWPFYPSV